MILAKVATSVIAAATVACLVPAPAWANDFDATYLNASKARWDDSSNTLVVTDLGDDRLRAYGQLRRPNGDVETLFTNGDMGNSNERSFPLITENARIAIRACVESSSGARSCGSWVDGLS